MTLPPTLAPLAQVVPPERAMRELVLPMEATAAGHEGLVGALPTDALRALAWLYLGDLERAHAVCQAMDDPLGAHLHAIVHRREGDYGNALYWYRRAGEPEGEGARLTRDVAAGDRSDEAVERQRTEWWALAERLAA